MTTASGIVGIGMPSPQELLPIIVILILFFGAARLPKLARSLGRSITEFKRGREDTGSLQEEEQSGDTPGANSGD